jgi:hypothetical protein
MHCLIPFASPLSEMGRETLAGLPLPHLEKLLSRWRETRRDEGDEWSLSPPHERAHAHALGWTVADGLLPWAALHADQCGIARIGSAWAELTPVHCQVATDQVSLGYPAALQLDADESRQLLAAVRPLFESEGFELHWQAPLRWLAAHDSLAAQPTASLDRVIGRSIEPWLPRAAQARLLRRLQNEVQMQLYEHPVNEAREARGLPAVNSVWPSGCGRLQTPMSQPGLHIDDRLRVPALSEDWAAWREAWRALDAGPIAQLLDAGQDARLTLCGERSAVELSWATPGLWQRVAALRHRPSATALLGTL